MKKPRFVAQAPQDFWPKLQTLDSALHANAISGSGPWFLPRVDQEHWTHADRPNQDMSDECGGWQVVASWRGRRWLGKAGFTGSLYLIHTLLDPSSSSHAQPLDEVNLKYFKTPGYSILSAHHATHTSVYVSAEELANTERSVRMLGSVDPEANPTPNDCQVFLNEMEIGVAGAHRFELPPPETPEA